MVWLTDLPQFYKVSNIFYEYERSESKRRIGGKERGQRPRRRGRQLRQ
jgi:hypothetical protein